MKKTENEIVIDASCILEFLLTQSNKTNIVKTIGTANLLAPACLPYEIGNAISKLIKRKLLSVRDGVSVYHEFAKIPIRIIEPDIPNAIVLSGETKSYAYDSYYVSLAKQFGTPLFTLDEKMKSNAKTAGVKCL